MNKINFKNLPDETTPINASNLNTMQDNIEAEIEKKISKSLGTQFSGDLNDLVETGFTYAAGSATNIPVTGFSCYVTTIRYTDKYIIQKANRVSSTKFIEYERQCNNGVWTNWEPKDIETITNTNGTAIKYPDGTMICTGKKQFTGLSFSAWGTVFTTQAGNMKFDDFPQEFIDVPNISVSPVGYSGTSGDFWIMSATNNIPNKTNPGGYQAVRATTSSNFSVLLTYIAIGRWK